MIKVILNIFFLNSTTYMCIKVAAVSVMKNHVQSFSLDLHDHFHINTAIQHLPDPFHINTAIQHLQDSFHINTVIIQFS